MNATQLVQELKNQPEGIKELQEQKAEIDSKIGGFESNVMYTVFGKITLKQLRVIWNKADHTQRYWILDSNDYAEEIIAKLDSHGGLRDTEIIQEIIEEKWNKC